MSNKSWMWLTILMTTIAGAELVLVLRLNSLLDYSVSITERAVVSAEESANELVECRALIRIIEKGAEVSTSDGKRVELVEGDK